MRRSDQRQSVSGSLRVAALAMGEQEQVRSISGRLGGHFDSSRSLRDVGMEVVLGEETHLIPTPEGEEMVGEADLFIPKTAPPLFKWIWIALLCANAYAFYNIFIKKGSASINPILGGVILQFVAAVMGSVLLGGLMLAGDGMKLHADKEGIMWSICAGLAVGVAEMLSFFVSGMGVPVTHSIPVIIGAYSMMTRVVHDAISVLDSPHLLRFRRFRLVWGCHGCGASWRENDVSWLEWCRDVGDRYCTRGDGSR